MVNPTVVTLTQGCVALVSKEDWPLVSRHRWHAVRVAGGRIYAATTINGKRMYLHRFLVPGFAVVHHRNNDGLDNRRDNLLGASRGGLNIAAAEFPAGSCGYRGVTKTRNGRRFVAQCKVRQTRFHLGVFDRAEDAARAYDAFAREQFGEFAFQNFTEGKSCRNRGG